MSNVISNDFVHRPRKRFGQHFLKDPKVIQKILESVQPGLEDAVIEIGPGRGALTSKLLYRFPKLWAVEIDRDLVSVLRESFPNEQLNVVENDVLRMDWRELLQKTGGRKFYVVGNLPYNITGPFLFKLLEEADIVHDAVLMLQREVAQRLIAVPGGKNYGRISVLLGVRTKIEQIAEVSRRAFFPEPRVDSSVLKLRFSDSPRFDIADYPLFNNVVKFAFGQRRKMLRNSLRGLVREDMDELLSCWEEISGIDFDRRPEQLEIEEFVCLGNVLYSLREKQK
jgi:16S rRNA (adenine1518-N6/adenine1519-N6)-dimethyltransferase